MTRTGSSRVRAYARASAGSSIGLMSEKNGRARSASSSAVQRPGVARGGGHEPASEDRKSGEHPLDVLVGEDRRDDDIARGRQAGQHVAEAGEVVRAVPDLQRIFAETLEPPRQLDLRRARRRAGRGTPPRRRSRSARLLWPATTTCSAPFSRASPSHSGSPSDDDRARLDDRELLHCDRLARRAEHLRVLERDVRQHLDRRAEDVRRVVAAAEPRLDDGDVDLRRRELGQGGGGEHLELRRLDPLGLGAHALDRRLRSPLPRPRTRMRSLHPRTCGERYAPTASPASASSASIVRVTVDLPFVPTTWIDG